MPREHEPRLARAAALVADAARSRMLSRLLSGEAATAGELAAVASVTAATASGHLARLREAGFVICEPRGRPRYYRLARAAAPVAAAALALLARRQLAGAAPTGGELAAVARVTAARAGGH
ncbi:MAG: transcriptional regulator, partial [Burkholderiaceae bacterium]